MYHREHQFRSSLKGLLDLGMVMVAFVLAYVLRFVIEIKSVTLGVAPFNETISLLVSALLVWPVVFSAQGLYQPDKVRPAAEEVWQVAKATVLATLMLVGLTYFLREVRYSRLMVGLFAGFSMALVSMGRLALKRVQQARLKRSGARGVVVVGTGDLAAEVIAAMKQQEELGLQVVGVLAHASVAELPNAVAGVPVWGRAAEVGELLKKNPKVTQVVIALPGSQQEGVGELMAELALHTVDVKVVPDLYQYITLCGGLEEFAGLPIISLQHGPLVGWNSVAKRLFDIVVALAAIVAAGPVMLVTAILVKLSSKGPVLYRQERMGMDGETFHILKFRSMKMDSEVTGAQMAAAVDPRRTWFGTFIRKWSFQHSGIRSLEFT